MKKIMRARETFFAGDELVHKGKTADARHPLVKAHPDYWEELDAHIDFDVDDAPVEQATAAPGEKRTTKRTTRSG